MTNNSNNTKDINFFDGFITIDFNWIFDDLYNYNIDINNIFDEYHGKIYYHSFSDDLETITPIGFTQLYLSKFDLTANCNRNSDIVFFDAFDEFKSTTSRIADAIIEPHDSYLNESTCNIIGETNNQSILIIEQLIIFDNFRNNGLGSKSIEAIQNAFIGKAGIIALIAFPLKIKNGISTTTPLFFTPEMIQNDTNKSNIKQNNYILFILIIISFTSTKIYSLKI